MRIDVGTQHEKRDHQQHVDADMPQQPAKDRRQRRVLIDRLQVGQPAAVTGGEQPRRAWRYPGQSVGEFVGRTVQIGRDRHAHHRHRHGDRIDEVADHAQRQTQRGDHKGELADLRHPQAGAQRGTRIVTDGENAHAAGQRLAQDHRAGDQQRGHDVMQQHRRVDLQTDSHEEQRREHVAQRLDQMHHAGDAARFRHDGARQKRAQGHAETHPRRQQAGTETDAQHADQQGFVTTETGHVIHQPRQQQQPQDHAHDHEQAKVANQRKRRFRLYRATDGHGRQQGQHDDRQHVLGHQQAHHQLRKRVVPLPALGKHAGGHHRRRQRDDRAQEQRIHALPAKQLTDAEADPQHQPDLGHRDHQHAHSHLAQLAYAELQPQREHQQHDTEVGNVFDRPRIRHQHTRGMRADQHASEDVAQQYRLPQTLEQDRGGTGHDHHHGQVANETDFVHAFSSKPAEFPSLNERSSVVRSR